MKTKLPSFILALSIICCGLGSEGYAAQQNAVWNDADSLAALQQFNFNNQAATTTIKTRKAQLYSPPLASNADYAESPHQLRLLKTHKDNFDGTYHDRYDQYYKNIPVWGSQLIFHVDPKNNKKTLVNGNLVTGIEKDLSSVEPSLSKNEVLKFAQDQYQSKHPKAHFSHSKIELVIFIHQDKNNKQVAKLTYTVTFIAQFTQLENKLIIEKPFYIIDANNRQIYKSWNDLRSSTYSNYVQPQQDNSPQVDQTQIYQLQQTDTQTKNTTIQTVGIGLGGNMKNDKEDPNGPYKFQYGNKYPGLRSLGKFDVTVVNNRCFMKTDEIEVAPIPSNYKFKYDKEGNPEITYFPINQEALIPTHSFDCYLNLDQEENESFSTNNDAMYAATNLVKMYKNVYKFSNPFGTKPGVPIRIYTYVKNYDGAFAADVDEWTEGEQIYKKHRHAVFGSGKDKGYSYTSIDIIGHELTHIFTFNYSDLAGGNTQSGGINESFSDMGAIALINYVREQGYSWYKLDWTIGRMITKPSPGIHEGKPLRYMCDPPSSPEEKSPYDDSIYSFKKYEEGKTDPHDSAGIFNKAFCVLSKTKGWSIKDAFTLFANANANCWTKNSTFNQAACCVIKEAEKRSKLTDDVINAFDEVDVSTECESSIQQ